VAPRRADDPELELAFGDALDDALSVRDRERDRDARVLALELAEQNGDDGAAGARRGSYSERAPELPILAGLELFDELFLELQNPLCAAVERKACLGGLDASARTVEQPAVEAPLERPNLQADGRLRDAEPLRRLREALQLDDRAECT
jgi:hypothetical protein